MGDMNAKNPLWAGGETNNKGAIFEQLLLERDISVLNDNLPTHYHIQTNSYSVIDLEICSSVCLGEFSCKTLNNLHGSDNFLHYN